LALDHTLQSTKASSATSGLLNSFRVGQVNAHNLRVTPNFRRPLQNLWRDAFRSTTQGNISTASSGINPAHSQAAAKASNGAGNVLRRWTCAHAFRNLASAFTSKSGDCYGCSPR
jgi:hypothetical protein